MTEKTALDLLAERVRHLETLEEIMSNIHGWDGSAWRKLPLSWGYSDVYGEVESSVDVAAGDRILTFSTVPAGEVWVITGFIARCSTVNPASIDFIAIIGGVTVSIANEAYGAAWNSVGGKVHIVLKTDDNLRVTFNACLLNDDIYADAWGYKMLVSE